MTSVAKVYDVALVNIPIQTSDDILDYFGNEQLCAFRNYLVNDPNQVLNAADSADILVCYIPNLAQSWDTIGSALANKPVIVLTELVDYEMTRQARERGIELLLQTSDVELTHKIYGFIKLFILNQHHQVLVVDDSPVDGGQISALFEKYHLKTQLVTEPHDAFPALVKNTDISIIMMDFEMPNFNGVQLLNKIRESFPNRDFIILGCTGSREGVLKMLDAGAEEAFQKPLDPELLHLKLKKIIFNHHSQQHQAETLVGFTEILEKVSIEARNPLYVLYTLLDKVLDQQRMEKNYQEMLDMGLLAFEKLNHLLEDLQMFVQLHAHQTSVALKETSLDALIASQLFLESNQAQLKNIIINKELESGILANCDERKIESVVGSLTNRTLKFAKTGAELNVRLYRKEGRIVFEIEDNTSKLDLQGIRSYLNSSETPDNLVKNEIELGLVNSKAIVKQHGGEIGVKQGKGGNVLYFTIPENLSMKTRH